MYGLPQSTEVRRPLPKAQLYKKFGLRTAVCDAVDRDIARLDFVNWIAPQTLPAIAVGQRVKEIFVVEATLKVRDFAPQSILAIAKCIPQHIVYALRFGDEVRLAVYCTKLFMTPWQTITNQYSLIAGAMYCAPTGAAGAMYCAPTGAAGAMYCAPTTFLTLDAVWQSIVSGIGQFQVAEGNTLAEQIALDERRAKLAQQIESLERQMRSTTQTRRQREIYEQIKRLKGNGR